MINDEKKVDLKKLKGEALALLEINDFSKAAKAYRKIINSGDFSKETLINSSVCESEERLAFAHNVSKSDEWHAKLYEAQIAFEIRRYPYAEKICSSILKSFKLELKDELRIRIIRFKSSCYHVNRDIFIEDFLRIWESGNVAKPFRLLRAEILESIARIKDPGIRHALIRLSKNNSLSPEIIDFINKKAIELESLYNAIDSTKSQ